MGDSMTIIRYATRQTTRRGRTVMTYGYQFEFRGTRYRKMVGPTESMARDAEQAERVRLANERYAQTYGPRPGNRTPLDEAIRRYVEAKAHKASLDHDESRLAWWQSFLAGRGVDTLQSVTADHLMAGRRDLEARGAKAATVYQYFALMRGLCRLGVRRWRILAHDPTTEIDWPKPRPKDVRIPTAQEFRALLLASDALVRALILTAVYTGLRRGAVCRLTAEDRQYRRGWVRGSEEKGDKTVWIYETPALKAILDARKIKTGPLFRWEDGTPLARFPRKRWDAAREKAGVPWMAFHDLRHMAGQLLAAENVAVRTIQKFLGHSHVGVTERYTQGLAEPLQEASKKLARRLGPYHSRHTVSR